MGFSPQGGESDFLLIQSRWSGGLCPGALWWRLGFVHALAPAATCSSDRPVARVRTALHTVCLPLTRPTSRAVREPLRVVTKRVCEPLPGHGSHFSGGGGDLGEAMGNARTQGYRPRSGATPPAPPCGPRPPARVSQTRLPVAPRRCDIRELSSEFPPPLLIPGLFPAAAFLTSSKKSLYFGHTSSGRCVVNIFSEMWLDFKISCRRPLGSEESYSLV